MAFSPSTAHHVPLRQMEPQLTPEQEDAGWAFLDALDAMDATDNVDAYLAVMGLFLDWQMAVGMLTREEWRQHTAPMLPDAVRKMRSTPAGRRMLAQLRKDATANLKSADYSERAGAALFLQVSMPPKRKPAKKRAGPTRDELARSSYMAERMQGLVGALGFDEHKKSRSQHADDAREAYYLARRIVRLLGVRQ